MLIWVRPTTQVLSSLIMMPKPSSKISFTLPIKPTPPPSPLSTTRAQHQRVLHHTRSGSSNYVPFQWLILSQAPYSPQPQLRILPPALRPSSTTTRFIVIYLAALHLHNTSQPTSHNSTASQARYHSSSYPPKTTPSPPMMPTPHNDKMLKIMVENHEHRETRSKFDNTEVLIAKKE